ncbi:MAG: hypothetical protein A3K75_00740 [Euryarchaeota archaeon RBG_13_61_15]|nr:MAG: hypothetical protein A3K75_00740 [Euryarchaeota archaeon RBG_13_61_15]
MTPKRAIVRKPGKSFTRCVSCHPMRNTVDLAKACEQHAVYRRTLSELGLEVIELPADDVHPDSCFVEDNAVAHGGNAIICRMAVSSRRGEEDDVEDVLRQYLRIGRVEGPGTLEGGDVVHFNNRLISGVSQRTNMEGVRQMRSCLRVKVDTIADDRMMHLKSHLTHLGRNTCIVNRRYLRRKVLQGLRLIPLPKEEAYAADALAIGDIVLMSSGRTKAHKLVKDAGFDVLPIDTSEFEKCDGALTCLSILF